MGSSKQRLEEETARRQPAPAADQVPQLADQALGTSARALGGLLGPAAATASTAHVLALQQSAGNRAVQRMLDTRVSLLRQEAAAGAGGGAAAGGVAATPMPGPRAGLTILAELDRIHTAMTAGGHPTRIGSGLRTIDEQIQLYAKGRTFTAFSTDLAAAATAGSVTQAKKTEWTDYYDPAQGKGNNPMPAGEPGPVTWTFTSRHLTGDAADVVHQTLGWEATPAFWTALNTAAVAEALQIGPPASDVAHVQRP